MLGVIMDNIIEYKARNSEDVFFVREGTSDQLVVNECYGKMYLNDRTNYNSNDIVLDVGCNIGAFSTRVSKHVNKIISYEPEVNNFALAKKNFERNNVQNVEIHNYALVANDDPTLTFYVNTLKNKGMHSIIPTKGRDTVTINCRRFSTALAESKANKVKLDVEGAEWSIFNENHIDWSNVENIIMEWHQAHLKDKDQSKFEWLLGYLGKHFNHVHAPKPTMKSWTSIIFASK
jgi:FkbM family methyltransferase